MASSFMRGALIEFTATMLVPLPNVIIFQYNPETISHTFSQRDPQFATDANHTINNPLAVVGMPNETFSFTLLLDSNDDVALGNPIALSTGIYSRLAALELLLWPSGTDSTASLVGTVSAATGAAGAAAGATGAAAAQPQVPVGALPMVLFIWGPGRIVPVRVTGLTVTEKLFDVLLNPTHAEAQISMTVLTPDVLAGLGGPLASVATAAYNYTQLKRQVLALANLANGVESIIGMIP